MAGPLDGKVALITGSSRGIGAAIAERFARDGAKVVVNYAKSADAAKEVVAKIEKAGGKAIAVHADVSKPEEVQPLFDAVKKEYGQLDIFVNNAAIMVREPLEEITADSIDRHIHLNIRGYILCAQAASKMLPKGGVIINISSAISRMAYPGAVVYTATKGAIDVMSRVLAAELGPKGIRVNAVAPGSTRTDMNSTASGKTKAEEKQEIEMTALHRQGEVEDIADACALLVRDDARWVTGANLDVSGGIRL